MNNIRFMEIAPNQKHELRMDAQSHFETFEVKNDATLRKKVFDLAHSTFDLSKFTVVGSPNITDDGIASGFSNSNTIQTPFPSSVTNFTAELNFKFNDTSTVSFSNYCIHASTSPFMIFINVLDGKYSNIEARFTNSNISAQYSFGNIVGSSHFLTERIYFEYRLLNNVLSCRVRFGETGDWINFPTTHTITDAIQTKTYSKLIGYSSRFNCDLKQFSIKVNGVEFFSGNKTGIDVIKPDNYTVVGTPAISADGVASGFVTNTNYLTVPILPENDFILQFEFNTNETISDGQYLFRALGMYTSSNVNLFKLYYPSNGTLIADVPKQVNSKYKITIQKTGLNIITSWNINGTTISSTTKTLTSNTNSHTTLSIGEKVTSSNTYFDLNAFKIYADGNLVYQPCLKIPYTEGQNYVKVVDKLYRDRIKDLFEQKGYNGYYTIGEDDFTLPSNKWSDIVEHKENGLTVAEQRVDQTLTIRGACEQGVDVNLPMEFFSADSYAVFGVGTTGTNTASKFTPAADGNYIAIGKGKV